MVIEQETSLSNIDDRELWFAEGGPPDLGQVFRSCLVYARTPGWAFVQGEVRNTFGSFKGLQTVELGCGLGKVSLLFSLLGARTTLLDYSERALGAAKFVHAQFDTHPDIINADLLHLPKKLCGRYDVAMSFGTMEHFWNADRQCGFQSHVNMLRPGGLAILWVPNRYGFLFHLGRSVRILLGRPIGLVRETSFTRRELYRRARDAGLTDIRIRGGGLLRNDFCHFIVDLRRLFGRRREDTKLLDADRLSEVLRTSMETNSAKIRVLGNFFSYPLVLIGRRQR